MREKVAGFAVKSAVKAAASDADLVAVSELIAQSDDVKRVIKIVPFGELGRFRYLIETTFATFPKFVIGTTDAHCDDVHPHIKCGALWSALQAWDEIEAARVEVAE